MSMSWIQRIHILLDVVDGLSYLHLLHKSVHQDLKSPNILLERIDGDDITHRAKIADFGLSKIFTSGKTRVGMLCSSMRVTRKSLNSQTLEHQVQQRKQGTKVPEKRLQRQAG